MNFQRPYFSFLLFFLIFLLSDLTLAAQEQVVVVTGIVRDIESHTPLPAVNIRVVGTSRGTTTNSDGAYRLLLQTGTYLLTVGQIGYTSDTVTIEIQGKSVQCDISLRQTTLPLPEFVVYGNLANPADEIIRKAIARKKNALSQLHSYQFKAYTKTTLRAIKTKDDGKDTIIAGLLETQTDGFWKGPDKYKEIITARKQSANVSPAQNIFTAGRIPNLNDDRIVLEPLSIVGPTAPDALDYYTFEILDTLAMDHVRIFRLRMKPKTELRPLFDGTISIADKSFLVMGVDIHGNSALILSPMENIRLRQRFSLYEDKFWLPIESQLDFDVKLPFLPISPVFFQQYSLFHDYKINSGISDSVFDKYLVSTLPAADRYDSVTWNNADILPLTLEEASAYQRLDSIMSNTNIAVRSIVYLAQLPLTFRELPLTSFSDFFHFDRVEGGYVGAGFRLDHLFSMTPASFSMGYGFADKQWKYSVSLEQYFSSSHTMSLGVEAHRRLQFREGESVFSRGAITWLTLLDETDPVDYYRAEGWSAFSCFRPPSSFFFEIRYLDELESSVRKNTDHSLFSSSAMYRTNPPILDGHLRSAGFSFEYDTRKYIEFGMLEEPDESIDAWFVNFNGEYTNSKSFQSDFSFSRCAVIVQRHQHGLGAGLLKLRLRFGFSIDKVPPQRLFDLESQTGDIAPEGAFKSIHIKEFAGDRLASFQCEYNFQSLVFRLLHLPLLQNADFIVYSGTAWTDLSRESTGIQLSPVSTTNGVLQEAGFAVGRILGLFRLDFTWRLTHRTCDNFTITLGSSLF